MSESFKSQLVDNLLAGVVLLGIVAMMLLPLGVGLLAYNYLETLPQLLRVFLAGFLFGSVAVFSITIVDHFTPDRP